MRIRIFLISILYHKIMRLEEGATVPEWMRWVFFPIRTYIENKAHVYFNPINQTYRIEGVLITKKFLLEVKNTDERVVVSKHDIFTTK